MEQADDKEDTPLSNNGNHLNGSPMTREEYTEKLKEWFDQARLWHSFCSNLPYYQTIQNQNIQANVHLNNFWNQFNNLTNQNLRDDQGRERNGPNELQTDIPVFQIDRTYEFKIPSLWKRLAAETIDFLILLFIKLFVTLAVTQSLYAINLDNYDFNVLRKNWTDPKVAMQMPLELMSLEFLHRFIVCVYEIYWLKGEMCATPGKLLMGMVVIEVSTIIAVPGTNDNRVRCTNVKPLGLKRSIFRAVLKNIILAPLIPVCFAFYVFRFNRTGYDAMIDGLVVEYPPYSVIY